jgi:hypothetical protein
MATRIRMYRNASPNAGGFEDGYAVPTHFVQGARGEVFACFTHGDAVALLSALRTEARNRRAAEGRKADRAA